ncbi:universal stress protein [Dactylosporangium sp. NPDC049525]|uniref:universal stress protein n=1 Tax=Dactylosporangium sp. NPDC049525 TaxID=3154730 RepID=UPI00343C7B22
MALDGVGHGIGAGERSVVVGISQSLAGLAALRYALAEARHRKVPLCAVRAWPLPLSGRGPAVIQWQYELKSGAQRYVVDAFDAAVGGPPDDVEVRVVTPCGRADAVLLDLANGSGQLLVLGARTTRRWLWPSWVVRGCVRAARCPVIVVPPPDLVTIAGSRRRFRTLSREIERFTAGGLA